MVSSSLVSYFITLFCKKEAKRMTYPTKDMTFKAFWGSLLGLVVLSFLVVVPFAIAILCLFDWQHSWWVSAIFFPGGCIMAYLWYVSALGLKDIVVVGPKHIMITGARANLRNVGIWRELSMMQKRYNLDLKWDEIQRVKLEQLVLYFHLKTGESYSLPLGPYDSKLPATISKFIKIEGF